MKHKFNIRLNQKPFSIIKNDIPIETAESVTSALLRIFALRMAEPKATFKLTQPRG
jgi:hypothetical protein